MAPTGPTADVVCVGAQQEPVAERLAAELDQYSIETVSSVAAVADRPVGSIACVVAVVEAGALSVDAVERVAARDVPVVAFVDPTASADAALTAGATDVVTAAGSDRYAVLAHRIETTLRGSEPPQSQQAIPAQFAALTNNDSFAVMTIDDRSRIQFASPATEDIFGYPPAELEGQSLTTIMPERFHDAHHEGVATYLASGERSLDWSWIELPGRHRDGTEIPLGISFGETVTDDGRLFSAIIRDMRDQQAREAQLDRLATAVEASMDGIALLDADGRYEYVNAAHAAIYGYDDPAALEAEHWRTLYEDAEVARLEADVLPTVADEGQWRGELTGRRADGSTFPQDISLTQLDDGGLVCVVRDISDQVRRRDELQSERRFVESIIDALPDAFYVLGDDGTFKRWNDELNAVTGYSDAELDGMDALAVIPETDHDRVGAAIAAVLHDHEPVTIESALLTKQGEAIPHEFSGSPLRDADGTVTGLVGIGRDISSKRLREQRLSVLSRVLRHNVRNRTTVIRGRAEQVADHVTDPELSAALDTVDRAAAALESTSEHARLAERLLRDRDTERQPIDLCRVVEAALETAETAGIDLSVDLPDTAVVTATGHVQHAVTELVDNARSHIEDPTIRVAVTRGDDHVRIRVADDGPGIPGHEREAVQSDAETPLAHGTGIGLWLVAWITSSAGGTLTFEESSLGGTAVVLSFPAA
ncbi:PAS domain S-box protein [Halosimplex halobium]|uniref:PAS domain-containing protein n=1 Tax=Halosimplex halobium TaxID=3396618 RepID=UPI003F57DF24